ncbi:SIS domain-containing protein [Olegusella massiliensis]|uniref:SIS domain-containing protein n=1 Tax=Olegusella massiliensis TaxID=1776381 RepID=UPI0008388112|nr:SIS domain-containing protein [Olegusella massiliensis]
MSAEKQSAMLEEIEEQPFLLRELWSSHKDWTAPFVELCMQHKFKRVLFVGNGSPYYAGETLRFLTERCLRAAVDVVPAAVFAHHENFDPTGDLNSSQILLICPAETGHSKGQVDAARRARSEHIPVVCTTLNPKGVLARECDVVLSKLGLGERSVAATKHQTMALFLVMTCLVEAGYALGNLKENDYELSINALCNMPDSIQKSIDNTIAWFAQNQEIVMSAPAYYLVGYGANLGTCLEGTLKFIETHERPTCAIELEETLHGPLRAVHKNDVVFLLSAEPGEERDRMDILARGIQKYCDHIVVIHSVQQQTDLLSLPIASCDIEDICALEYLIPLQVLSALIAQQVGIDVTIPKVSELDDLLNPAYED